MGSSSKKSKKGKGKKKGAGPVGGSCRPSAERQNLPARLKPAPGFVHPSCVEVGNDRSRHLGEAGWGPCTVCDAVFKDGTGPSGGPVVENLNEPIVDLDGGVCKVCKIVRYCSRYCAVEAHRNGFENWHAEHCTRLLPGDKIVYNRETASGHVVRDGPSAGPSLAAPPAGPAPLSRGDFDADGKLVVDGYKDRDKVQAYIANKLRDELLANPDVDVDAKIDELVSRFKYTFDDESVRMRLGGGPPGPGARGGAGSTSGRS